VSQCPDLLSLNILGFSGPENHKLSDMTLH
jgi:hypothetical protein